MKALKAILVILIILCVGAFFVGKYSTEISEFLGLDEEETVVEEVEEITQEEALSYINSEVGISLLLDTEDESVTNMSEYFEEVDNQKKLANIFLYLDEEEFNVENVEEAAVELYGSVDAIEHEDFLNEEKTYYYYDEDLEEYFYDETYDGSATIDAFETLSLRNVFVDFKRENNVFVLTVNKLYLSEDFKVYGKYSDYNLANEDFIFDASTLTDKTLDSVTDYFLENYETLEEKVTTYKYVLTKKDGLISIVSYEII